jgi:hypothetical protein
MPTAAVFVLLAVTIGIIVMVVAKPEITMARGGKIPWLRGPAWV